MTRKPKPFESVVAEAPPAVETAPVAAKTAAKLELDGDEIIQFSIKPSVWFIPLAAGPWVLALCLVGTGLAVAMRTGSTPESIVPFQILAGLAALSAGIATLQWATRLYVLTNRRVMRFKGIFNVDVIECPLSKISAADLRCAWHQRLLHLGTIHMTSILTNTGPIVWEQLAQSADIHERLVRAIRKAQSRS